MTSYRYHDYTQPDPPHQPLYLEPVIRYLRSESAIRSVLDAGCGDGNFTVSLAEAGFRMYGLDLSSGGIAQARKSRNDITFAEASVYDDLRESFPDKPVFDAVVSVEVIEHLYSPREFARRCHEALRPGGLLIVTTPYWGYLKNLLLALTNRIDRSLTALWEGGHIKHWSYRTLRSLFTEQGFEYVGFVGAGRSIPFLWKGMVMVFRKP